MIALFQYSETLFVLNHHTNIQPVIKSIAEENAPTVAPRDSEDDNAAALAAFAFDPLLCPVALPAILVPLVLPVVGEADMFVAVPLAEVEPVAPLLPPAGAGAGVDLRALALKSFTMVLLGGLRTKTIPLD